MNEVTTLSNDIASWSTPLIAATLALVIGLAMKDWAANLITGLKFKFDEAWHEGGHCFIDGEPAVIVKIGISETVFQIQNGRGTVWRHVSNERIKYLRIERVIDRRSYGHEN
jgi:small-conductance mechanosensitive channel